MNQIKAMVKQTEILTFGHQQLKVVEWVILDKGEGMNDLGA